VEGSLIRYGVTNANQDSEVEDLILAYRKVDGKDKRVRFMVGRKVNDRLKVMPYFLKDEESLEQAEELKAGNFIWGLSHPFRDWLITKHQNGELVEGETYEFKKNYKIALLTTAEMDVLAASTIHYGKYDTNYTFE